jgi:hypothetical protein
MIITWAVMVFFLSGYVQGIIYVNHTEDAFIEEDLFSNNNAEYVASNSQICDLIMYGAGYFLKSGAAINLLSERIEMIELQGFDYYGLYENINDAVYNLEMVAYYYQHLVDRAENTSYNQTVINKLAAFDYQEFRIQKNLNRGVFDQVEKFLMKGDVRGAYKKIQKDVNSLLDRLYDIRWLIYWGNIPTNEAIWDLNQDKATMHLFGQYLSRVFVKIKE